MLSKKNATPKQSIRAFDKITKLLDFLLLTSGKK